VKRERMFRIGVAGVVGIVTALGAVPRVFAVAKIHPVGVVLQQSDGTPIADATVTIDFEGQETTARTGPDGVLPIVLVADGAQGVGKVGRTGDGKVKLIGDGSGRIRWVGGPAGGEVFAVKDGKLTVEIPVELERIPAASDPWAILQQTPGVLIDRINIGDMNLAEDSTTTQITFQGQTVADTFTGDLAKLNSGVDLPLVETLFGVQGTFNLPTVEDLLLSVMVTGGAADLTFRYDVLEPALGSSSEYGGSHLFFGGSLNAGAPITDRLWILGEAGFIVIPAAGVERQAPRTFTPTPTITSVRFEPEDATIGVKTFSLQATLGFVLSPTFRAHAGLKLDLTRVTHEGSYATAITFAGFNQLAQGSTVYESHFSDDSLYPIFGVEWNFGPGDDFIGGVDLATNGSSYDVSAKVSYRFGTRR
jgi:hypothetical protein